MPAPTIDRALLSRLEEMARLHIPADRQPVVRERLQRIVEAFAALRDLPTARAEATPSAPPAPTPLRPDQAGPVLTPAEVLANAPQQAAGCFLVPRVVDA
jgi:aspartyl-tRNA(Asn)/glutamyl-tRNA(Gln) amidotransferase subunit C